MVDPEPSLNNHNHIGFGSVYLERYNLLLV